jgi:hypothetical protein
MWLTCVCHGNTGDVDYELPFNTEYYLYKLYYLLCIIRIVTQFVIYISGLFTTRRKGPYASV